MRAHTPQVLMALWWSVPTVVAVAMVIVMFARPPGEPATRSIGVSEAMAANPPVADTVPPNPTVEREPTKPTPIPKSEPLPSPEPVVEMPGLPSPDTIPPAPTVALLDSSVVGEISGIGGRLTAIDAAVEKCWATAVAVGDTGERTLTLSFTIKWNRNATSILARGDDVSKSLARCVKKAVPIAKWPEPANMGDATVTRRWILRG